MEGVAGASVPPLLGGEWRGMWGGESWGRKQGDRLLFLRSCVKNNYESARARYLSGGAAGFRASPGGLIEKQS